jgi:hypothetical protein
LSGGEAEIRVQSDVRAVEEAVPAPPAAVWQALPAVYRELGIPVSAVDSAALSLTTHGFEIRGQLAGKRLSTYFSCGTNLTGEIADQRRVRIDLASRVVEAAEGTSVLSAAGASARSDAGASADPVVCASRGTLERLIGVRARLHIAKNWPPANP